MTIYKKQPRDLKTTSTATAAESAARTSAGLDELFSASARTATVQRVTGETDITLTLTLDGTGSCDINTGVPFFDHMLNAFGRHGLFDLKVEALGDTEVDAHHTVEDTGIVLGRAFAQALGDKARITRFADVAIPMDETLVMAAVDISGRGQAYCDLPLPTERGGVLLRFCARCRCDASCARARGRELASHHRGRLQGRRARYAPCLRVRRARARHPFHQGLAVEAARDSHMKRRRPVFTFHGLHMKRQHPVSTFHLYV